MRGCSPLFRARPMIRPRWPVLGRGEIERVARLGLRADRDLATCARVAARIEIGRRLGVAAADVPLDDSGGPPSIRGADTTVSWSHSGRWLALALAAGRAVGVDIEEMPQRLDLAPLAELDVLVARRLRRPRGRKQGDRVRVRRRVAARRRSASTQRAERLRGRRRRRRRTSRRLDGRAAHEVPAPHH